MIDRGNYYQWYQKGYQEHDTRAWKEEKVMETLTTRGGSKVALQNNCIGTYEFAKSENFMQGKSRFHQDKDTMGSLLTSPKEAVVNGNLRIRRLTPKECFSLMGVKPKDFEKVAKNQSDSSLYHLAGDSIVVNVLMAIFKELL